VETQWTTTWKIESYKNNINRPERGIKKKRRSTKIPNKWGVFLYLLSINLHGLFIIYIILLFGYFFFLMKKP